MKKSWFKQLGDYQSKMKEKSEELSHLQAKLVRLMEKKRKSEGAMLCLKSCAVSRKTMLCLKSYAVFKKAMLCLKSYAVFKKLCCV